MVNQEQAIKTTYLSIAGNASLALLKGLVGYFGHSYALIADAIESTSDIFSSIIVMLGLKYANKPPDQSHPYGHGKAEPLVTFAVVGFLIISATIIGYESIQHIRIPHELPKPYTLIVLGCIIVIKEIFYRIILRRSKQTNSTSLKADAWHHRSDAITSLTAFAGISIALILGKGYESADDWAALIGSSIILYNSYLIFRPALGEIMEENLYEDLVEEIRIIAKKVDGVKDTEKCYVRKAGLQYFVDLHITVEANISVKEGHAIAHKVQSELKNQLPQISSVLVHIEPNEQ